MGRIRRWRPELERGPSIRGTTTRNEDGLPNDLLGRWVFNELADSMHRAVQKIMLTNADIQKTLDDAAAEVDRATAGSSKG